MDFQQERTDREIMSTRVNAVEEEYKKKLKLAETELLHLKSMGMADTAGRPRSARRREEKPPVMLPNPFSHALSGSYSPPTSYTSSQVGAFSAPGEREKREREERERDRAVSEREEGRGGGVERGRERDKFTVKFMHA